MKRRGEESGDNKRRSLGEERETDKNEFWVEGKVRMEARIYYLTSVVHKLRNPASWGEGRWVNG